jgi:hypothetical protein
MDDKLAPTGRKQKWSTGNNQASRKAVAAAVTTPASAYLPGNGRIFYRRLGPLLEAQKDVDNAM